MKTLAWVCLSWASLCRQLLSSLPWGHAYSKAAQGRRKQLSLPWKHHFPETHHNAGIRQIQTRPAICTGGIHTAIIISPTWAAPHQHLQVMDKSWGDLYLLAPMWCPGEYMYGTVYGDLCVTTHLLAHRNCLSVCLRGSQHAVNNSSYPSQSSFSAHWAGDSATSCFIILDAFQKKLHLMAKQNKINKKAFKYLINTSTPHGFCNPNTRAQTTWKWDYFALFTIELFTKKRLSRHL